MLTPRVTLGVSLKAYFGNRQAESWLRSVADIVRDNPAVHSGTVELFVAPSYLQIHHALSAFVGTPVRVAAQDVSAEEPGPATGEVTAAELAEIGVTMAEIGHAERRSHYGETDEVVALKTAAALRNGLTPLVCLGEGEHLSPEEAARTVIEQLNAALDDAPDGRVIIAYEPVWAIGAVAPAPLDHIRHVAARVRSHLHSLENRTGSSVLYGGSAGPGLLHEIGNDVDGLFLGRFAHQPEAFAGIVNEAVELAGGAA